MHHRNRQWLSQLTITILQLAISFSAPRAVAAEVIDRVLAVVAGQVIMLSDVTAARDLGLVKPGDPQGDPIGAVLSKLIDRELILAQVDRYSPPEPGAEAIDREVQNVRARLAQPDDFAAALSRSGIDEQHLREILREDLRIREYEDERFTVPAPGDVELGRYYREHPQMFMRDRQPMSFEDARAEIARVLIEEQRSALIAGWVAGLRRRADIVDLYSAGRK